MRSTKASARYAKSLLDLAGEQGRMENVKADMELVLKTIAESHELDLLMHSPIIKTDAKQKVLQKIFKSHISDLSMQFMNLITAKGREAIMADIARAFIASYKELHGIVTAEVTTAVALTEEQREAIRRSLSSWGKTIELQEKTDPSILGGMKIKMGDKRVDASIRKKLNELRIAISKQKLSAI